MITIKEGKWKGRRAINLGKWCNLQRKHQGKVLDRQGIAREMGRLYNLRPKFNWKLNPESDNNNNDNINNNAQIQSLERTESSEDEVINDSAPVDLAIDDFDESVQNNNNVGVQVENPDDNQGEILDHIKSKSSSIVMDENNPS